MSALSEEFGTILAPKFDNSDLSEYAALCWIAASQCEQSLENNVSAVDYLIRAANAFVRADNRSNELFPGSHNHEHIAGAVRCYNDALSLLSDDSAMSAGIIRQLKKICPRTDKSSNFISPTHRIQDLERSARLHICNGHYIPAMENLTEVFDILNEEKTVKNCRHLLSESEVLLLFLLLLLQLPPGRQSPIHMQILKKYSPDNRNILKENEDKNSMTGKYLLALQNIVCACTQDDGGGGVDAARYEVLSSTYSGIFSREHDVLLKDLAIKFK